MTLFHLASAVFLCLFLVIFFVATRGKGYRIAWQLLRVDMRARFVAIVSTALWIFIIGLLLYPFLPGSGIIVFCCILIEPVLQIYWSGRLKAFRARLHIN